jgi:hypothetical protein
LKEIDIHGGGQKLKGVRHINFCIFLPNYTYFSDVSKKLGWTAPNPLDPPLNTMMFSFSFER